MKTLSLDLESYSEVDIKTAGLYKYAAASEVLMLAYSYDYGPVEIIDLSWEELPQQLIDDILDPCVLKTAQNAAFERAVLGKYLGVYLAPEQWEDTMIVSAMAGLPLSLDECAKALELEQQKNSVGKALIKYFCIPCKPTKINGMRTRNLPEHDLEKWDLFLEYCKQDVVTEQAIRKALSWLKIPEMEQKLWCLDQRINERGVRVDFGMAQHAIQMDLEFRERLTAEAVDLTGLANPNSVAQIKKWLEEQDGTEIKSLNKDTLGLLTKEATGDSKRLLEIRQDMSKTSVKKYSAMINAAGDDHRVRGLFQFYGANKTGRWAGRLVQVQNLTRGNFKPEALDCARDLVLKNDMEGLEMCFGAIPESLSSLIRTTFIPSKGNRLIVSDMSAIEARVIAWLAGEEWRLEVFRTHGKIYEASAASMFKVPLDSITEDSPLRQKGKVTELSCIAKGQLVLTNHGLIPIESVSLEDKIWDGTHWVTHAGVIFKGYKKVITYEKLTATENHLVWVCGKSEPIHFGESATRGSHLLQSGNGGQAIRLGEDYQPGEKVEKELGRTYGTHRVYGLQRSTMVKLLQFKKRKEFGVSRLFPTKNDTYVVRPQINSSQTALRKSKGQGLQKLRCSGCEIQFRFNSGSRSLDNREFRSAEQRVRIGSYGQQSSLRERKFKICNQNGKSSQSANNSFTYLGRIGMAVLPGGCYPDVIRRAIKRTNYFGSKKSSFTEKKKLERHTKEVAVFDIVNAGPNNRFTVSDVLVHNCGYQGGTGALIRMGAIEKGAVPKEIMDLPEDYREYLDVEGKRYLITKEKKIKAYLQTLITAWRKASPAIVKLWRTTQTAMMEAIKTGERMPVAKGVYFQMKGEHLLMHFPAGGFITYPFVSIRPRTVVEEVEVIDRSGNVVIEETKRITETVHYWGVNQTTRKWEEQTTYGGKGVENMVQRFARDCLGFSLLSLDEAGYPIVMHVHDEAVGDVPVGFGSLDDFNTQMLKRAPWMGDLPLKVKGFEASYYRKD